MNTKKSTYRLYAQYQDGRIILENMLTGSYISSTAQEIIQSPNILGLLCDKDAAIIRFIADQKNVCSSMNSLHIKV